MFVVMVKTEPKECNFKQILMCNDCPFVSARTNQLTDRLNLS